VHPTAEISATRQTGTAFAVPTECVVSASARANTLWG